MNPILADEKECVRWCRVVGLHESHASHLVAHFARIEAMPADAIDAWRVAQDVEIADVLTGAQIDKVKRLLRLGTDMPFGQALEKSEARHDAHLWWVIATTPSELTPRYT